MKYSNKTIIFLIVSTMLTFVVTSSNAEGYHPPVTHAGKHHKLTFHNNTNTLDGFGSTNQASNIACRRLTKTVGPLSFNTANLNVGKTQISNHIQSYPFESKLSKAGELFSRDTLLAAVNASNDGSCDIINRPLVSAQLIQVGTLPQARMGSDVASVSNKVLIVGGRNPNYPYGYSPRVDIFDVATNSWSTAELSQARYGITVIYG